MGVFVSCFVFIFLGPRGPLRICTSDYHPPATKIPSFLSLMDMAVMDRVEIDMVDMARTFLAQFGLVLLSRVCLFYIQEWLGDDEVGVNVGQEQHLKLGLTAI